MTDVTTDRTLAEPAEADAFRDISAGKLGMWRFLASEIMIFGGLISAFYILRAGSFSWSPIGQPRLPIAVTGINMLILFGGGIAMRFAVGAAKRKQRGAVRDG